MQVSDRGWLLSDIAGEPRVVQIPTVRTTALEVPRPLGIVWHWTAGRCGPGFAEGCCKEIEHYDPTKDRAASWHFLIAKDGTIFQCASCLVGTWHVGRAGAIGDHPSVNVNRCTIGVELENAGRLLKLGPRCYCWPYWLNPDAPTAQRQPDPKLEVEATRARPADGGFWKYAEGGNFDAFPPAQVASATALLKTLVAAYGWKPEVCVYGHLMFDFPRKEDPGPLWLKEHLPAILAATFPAIAEDPTPTPG